MYDILKEFILYTKILRKNINVCPIVCENYKNGYNHINYSWILYTLTIQYYV